MGVDIQAMSGATTGNILNAVEIDESHKQVENVIIVAGQNELQAPLTEEEFLLCLKMKGERLKSLATSKNVGIVKPPPQKSIDPLEQAKEIVFHDHLAEIANEVPRLKVWDNPIDSYEEDACTHPSPSQTTTLLHHIDQKSKEDFGVSIFLKSGPNNLISTKKKYSGVQALYKYGCSACADKERNKWRSLCSKCTAAAKDFEQNGLGGALKTLQLIASDIRDMDNPPLQNALPMAKFRDRSPLKSDTNGSDQDEKAGAKKRVKLFHSEK